MDILAALYGAVLGPQDRFILSKGHAALALYAALAETGLLDPAELASFGRPGSRLCAHASAEVPHVHFSTGSLGHGLSVGCGMALAGRRVHVLLSDGECQEGSTWEAAQFAATHGLRNLTAIVDDNGLQACCPTWRVAGQGGLGPKWRAFGWDVSSADGHDHGALLAALGREAVAPHVIVARTVKGKGVPRIEGRVESHYAKVTEHEAGVCGST